MSAAQEFRPSRNWRTYNHNLRKRGSIIFSFDEKSISTLYHGRKQERGGARQFSPLMFEYLLTVKVCLRLPWRATVGFVETLFKRVFPSLCLKIPDYAHASREANKLALSIRINKPSAESGIELSFDSTGVNIYSTSGWHHRKYGKALYHNKEQWKKVHIALDLETMQIHAMEYTTSTTNDCEVVPQLCAKIKGKVASFRGDGAYDTKEMYRILERWQAKALIPPSRTSKSQDELVNPQEWKSYLSQRDKIIKHIRKHKSFDDGLKDWKKTSGYHKRSRIESNMFRLKKLFGFHLQQKTEGGRRNEIIAKINLLNMMFAM